jgi:hypothetical protein
LSEEVEAWEAARRVREGSKFSMAAKAKLGLRIEFLGKLKGGWFL